MFLFSIDCTGGPAKKKQTNNQNQNQKPANNPTNTQKAPLKL